jgi:hypothetical protein
LTSSNGTLSVGDEPLIDENTLTVAQFLKKQGYDSFSILPALQGSAETTHPVSIFTSITGHFSIRVSDWKLAVCKGSCGVTKGGDNNSEMQLYNMKTESRNNKLI